METLNDVDSFFETSLKSNRSATTGDLTYGDLLNQKITITFTLNDNSLSQNDKSEEVYTVTITGTVNSVEQTEKSVKTLNEALKKDANAGKLNYNVVFDEDTNTILFQLPTNPNLVPFNSDSDLADVISDFYFSGLYKSVTVKANGYKDSFILNEESVKDIIAFDGVDSTLTKGDIFIAFVDWLYKIGGENSVLLVSDKATKYVYVSGHVFNSTTNNSANPYGFNLSTLIDKNLTIELEYANESVKDESESNTYTIVFTDSINTDKDTEKLLSSLNGVELSSGAVDFEGESGKLTADGKNVKVTKTDFVYGLGLDKVENTLNTDKFIVQMMDVVKNYESILVNYAGKNYTIEYTEKTATEITDFGQLEELVDAMKNGKTIGASLQGKTLGFTYNLKNGNTNESKNGETYTIKFAVETNTNDIMNGKIPVNDKLVVRDLGTGKYISGDRTIIFDAKDPFATVNSLKDIFGSDDLFKGLLTGSETKGLYKSIKIVIDEKEYPISYNAETKKIEGLETLISDLRLETTMSALASKNIKVVITLNDGVMDYVLDNKNNKIYTEGNTLTYNVIISTKISALDTLKDADKYHSTNYSEKDKSDVRLKVKDGKILVLYNSELDAVKFFQNEYLIGSLRDIIVKDSRFRSFEINIGNNKVEVVKGSHIGLQNTETITDVNYKIRDSFEKLLNDPDKEEVVYGTEADMTDVIKALGNNKISITLNLIPQYATFEENGENSITYEFVYSEYEDLSKVFAAEPFDDMEDNVLEVKGDAGKDIEFSKYFTTELLDKLFKGDNLKNVSSITVNGCVITASKYASALAGNETNILVGNILDSINKQLTDLKIKTTVSASGEQPTSNVAVEIDDLVKNKVEIKFTVRMDNNVLSENGNNEETYTLTFALNEEE